MGALPLFFLVFSLAIAINLIRVGEPKDGWIVYEDLSVLALHGGRAPRFHLSLRSLYIVAHEVGIGNVRHKNDHIYRWEFHCFSRSQHHL